MLGNFYDCVFLVGNECHLDPLVHSSGFCISLGEKNKQTNMATCKEGAEEQILIYNFDTKQLLNPNSGLCLRTHEDGWLKLATCNQNSKSQLWNVSQNAIVNLNRLSSECIVSYDGNFPHMETCNDKNDNQNWNLQCKSKHKLD